MSTARLTSQGRITLPEDVRNALNLNTGDRVEFVQIAAGRYEVLVATRDVSKLKGMFGKPAKPVSIEDMNTGAARRAASTR